MVESKKVLSMALVLGIFAGISASPAFASDFDKDGVTVIPQVLVQENVYEENGSLTHEYVWKDNPISTYDALDDAEWLTSQQAAGELRHRSAKVCPEAGRSVWYAASETDYGAWHYSRCRILKTIGGAILEDSNQKQVNSGIAYAHTPYDKLYMMSPDFRMTSFWGT